MTKQFQVLIVGGGNAGLSVAAQLLQKNSGLQIGILEPNEKHFYQPAWTPSVSSGEPFRTSASCISLMRFTPQT